MELKKKTKKPSSNTHTEMITSSNLVHIVPQTRTNLQNPILHLRNSNKISLGSMMAIDLDTITRRKCRQVDNPNAGTAGRHFIQYKRKLDSSACNQMGPNYIHIELPKTNPTRYSLVEIDKVNYNKMDDFVTLGKRALWISAHIFSCHEIFRKIFQQHSIVSIRF